MKRVERFELGLGSHNTPLSFSSDEFLQTGSLVPKVPGKVTIGGQTSFNLPKVEPSSGRQGNSINFLTDNE